MSKAVAYYRVSTKDQKRDGFSIPAQRKLLKDFAREKGFRIVAEFEDDETAKRSGRTDYGNMIEYLENHQDVKKILVEKTDRLYRNLKDYVVLDEMDVTVFLVKENEVIGKDSTSHQKLIHGIKVLMAKNYCDNLSEEVKKGNRQKAEQGIFPGSTPPLGYKMGRLQGKAGPIVDENNRELAVRLFELYATGLYSIKDVINRVKMDGLLIPELFPKSSKLKTLTTSSVHRILRNPLYYGDFMWAGQMYHGGVHEPLITKSLWDQVQKMLDRYDKKGEQSNVGETDFILKPFLTCGECGRSITAERKVKPSGREYVYYRCTKFNTNCQQKAVNAKVLHKQISESLDLMHMGEEVMDYMRQALKESLALKRETVDRQRERLEQQKELYIKRIDCLYEDKLDKAIDNDFYLRKYKQYSDKLADITYQLSEHEQANADYYKVGITVLELANKAKLIYDLATPKERLELLGFVLSNCELKDKKLLIQYKKPFDIIYERSLDSNWRGLRDDFRTFDFCMVTLSYKEITNFIYAYNK